MDEQDGAGWDSKRAEAGQPSEEHRIDRGMAPQHQEEADEQEQPGGAKRRSAGSREGLTRQDEGQYPDVASELPVEVGEGSHGPCLPNPRHRGRPRNQEPDQAPGWVGQRRHELVGVRAPLRLSEQLHRREQLNRGGQGRDREDERHVAAPAEDPSPNVAVSQGALPGRSNESVSHEQEDRVERVLRLACEHLRAEGKACPEAEPKAIPLVGALVQIQDQG